MPNSRAHSQIDIRDIISLVWKRKWLVILPLVIVMGVAYGGSYLLKEKYESSIILWIDRPSNVSRELISLIGTESYQREGNDERRRKLASLQNELTSRAYLGRLIQDLKLDTASDNVRRAARLRQDRPQLSLEQLKLEMLVASLKEQIDVAYVGEDQIKITVQSDNPVQARDMVTRLTEIMEEEKTKYEMEKILDNQSFADVQLQKTEYDYQEARDSLTTARSRLGRLQLPENIASEANRRAILADIDQADLEIRDSENDLETLADQLSARGMAGTRLRYSDTLVELRADIDGLVGTFASMMEKYAWNEQNVINVNIRLNDNIGFLENEIARSIDRQFASLAEEDRRLLTRYFTVEQNLDILISKRAQLKLSLDKIDYRISGLARLQAEVDELQRRVDNARRYRDAFKSEEATVEILSERTKEMTKYKVIEPARVPLAPVWPDRAKITLLGVVLGLALGAVVILLVELLDASFKRVEDVEEELQLPVLAAIPRIENLKMGR